MCSESIVRQLNKMCGVRDWKREDLEDFVLVEFIVLFSQFRQRMGSVHRITPLMLFRDSPLISHYSC